MSDGAVSLEGADELRPALVVRRMFSRDFIYLAVLALGTLLTTVVTPLLTRRVGASAYGQFALAIVTMQILGPVFSLGLPFAVQKVYAGEDGETRAREVFGASLMFGTVLCVMLAVTVPLWYRLIGLDHALDARLSVVWAALFATTWSALAMLRSEDRLGAAIAIGLLQSLAGQALGCALLFAASPTVAHYLEGVIVGQAIACLLGIVSLRPILARVWQLRRHLEALRFGLPMVPQQLGVFVLFAGDRVVVRHDLGSVATGRYSVAYNVGCLGVVLLVFINQAWTPRIYAIADRTARARVLEVSRDHMSLLLIPVVFALSAAAPDVLRVWAPASFRPDSLAIIVSLVAICSFAYGIFLSNVRALMSEGLTGRVAVMTFLAAAVNIGLNLVLVPWLGIAGSAVATLASYLLLARLSRPPAAGGLAVAPTSPRLLAVFTLAMAEALAMSALPTTRSWLIIRLVAAALAGVGFLALARRTVAGGGE